MTTKITGGDFGQPAYTGGDDMDECACRGPTLQYVEWP